jgi:hypothetical protein
MLRLQRFIKKILQGLWIARMDKFQVKSIVQSVETLHFLPLNRLKVPFRNYYLLDWVTKL